MADLAEGEDISVSDCLTMREVMKEGDVQGGQQVFQSL